MSMLARMRESASMAEMAAAPPTEWPAIAIRDGSISAAPGQAGCAPVSSPSTQPTSTAPLVRTVLSASGGTPVMSRLVSWSLDSAGVMYRARLPSGEAAGYHSETISSRALTPATQGSGRAVSLSHTDVVPAGYGPVG